MHEHYWTVEMQLRELPYIRDTVQFNLAQILLLLPANHCPAITIHSLELRCDISGFDITKKGHLLQQTSKSFLVCTRVCIRTTAIEAK